MGPPDGTPDPLTNDACVEKEGSKESSGAPVRPVRGDAGIVHDSQIASPFMSGTSHLLLAVDIQICKVHAYIMGLIRAPAGTRHYLGTYQPTVPTQVPTYIRYSTYCTLASLGTGSQC